MRLSCVGFDCSASVIVVGQFLVGAMLSMRIETSIIARAMAFIATGMLYFMLTNVDSFASALSALLCWCIGGLYDSVSIRMLT